MSIAMSMCRASIRFLASSQSLARSRLPRSSPFRLTCTNNYDLIPIPGKLPCSGFSASLSTGTNDTTSVYPCPQARSSYQPPRYREIGAAAQMKPTGARAPHDAICPCTYEDLMHLLLVSAAVLSSSSAAAATTQEQQAPHTDRHGALQM
jgi:hypothetical protein